MSGGLRRSAAACARRFCTVAKVSGAPLSPDAAVGGDPISHVVQTYGVDPKVAKSGPFDQIRRDLRLLSDHMDTVVERADNEVMNVAAGYLLQNKGKLMRPALVTLAGYAAMPSNAQCRALHGKTMVELLDGPKDNLNMDDISSHPYVRHLRLAQVTELVHTASLIHDDCLDEGETRRGKPALHTIVGVKVAILAGDYMLARASQWLATLNEPRVVAAMSQALEDLPVGEIMQMQGENTLEAYMRKSFCKTSSLIAHSCKGAAILSNPNVPRVHEALFNYGTHLGTAFQIVDDILDFTSTNEELGKPAMNDIKCGVYTLPVLLAARQDARMEELLERGFSEEGDVQQAVEILERVGAIDEARSEAETQARLAREALEVLEPSRATEALANVLDVVLSRKK